MSFVQGGTVNIPLKSIPGVPTSPTTPIIADTSIPNALTPTGIQLLADYTLQSDAGALSRPTSNILPSFNFPLTIANGTRLQLSLCEAVALIVAGAARFS